MDFLQSDGMLLIKFAVFLQPIKDSNHQFPLSQGYITVYYLSDHLRL